MLNHFQPPSPFFVCVCEQSEGIWWRKKKRNCLNRLTERVEKRRKRTCKETSWMKPKRNWLKIKKRKRVEEWRKENGEARSRVDVTRRRSLKRSREGEGGRGGVGEGLESNGVGSDGSSGSIAPLTRRDWPYSRPPSLLSAVHLRFYFSPFICVRVAT